MYLIDIMKKIQKLAIQWGWIVFPLAYLLNSFSMAAMLLFFGIFGHSEVAADIGLVHGATLALFYAFSGNARNLVLAEDAGTRMSVGLLRLRLLLALPLFSLAYFLSVGIGGVAVPLASILIIRRLAEWIGEIGLASHEYAGSSQVAIHTLTLDSLSFVACLCLKLIFGFDLATSAIPWAVAPLWAIMGISWSMPLGEAPLRIKKLLPHLGSTAIIGCGIYVFRISIALIAGKVVAGDVFTAYVIGGLLPTIFGQSLAPTLAHRFGTSAPPRYLRPVIGATLLVGVVIATTAAWTPAFLIWSGRSTLFWLAVGLSIAGGAVMIEATTLRARLIHRAVDHGVFGADLMSNLLIATCVPFVYLTFGEKGLAGLYALSACLNLVFLLSVGNDQRHLAQRRSLVLTVIGVLLVLPVFFQINGGLFRDLAFVFDTGGVISLLPLPVSLLGLFGGIAILGNYAASMRTLTVLFFTALLFVITTVSTSQGNLVNEAAKLILLAQFMLPMFGLVLGEMYGASTSEPKFESSALLVFLAVLPLHLLSTWLQGYSILSPSLFLFSIYQHLQYFPMVVVAIGLLVVFTFWVKVGWSRNALWLLLPVLTIHVVASQSLAAMGGLFVGLVCFVYVNRHTGRAGRYAAILVSLALVAGSGYVLQSVSGVSISGQVRNSEEEQSLSDKVKLHESTVGESIRMPLGALQRVDYWLFYGRAIVESPSSLLLGHVKPPDRAVYPSAHNYWLDVSYNFGVLSLLPLLFLTFLTGYDLWQRRLCLKHNPALLGLAVSVSYLLLIENMLKVGMRQPYPGIITFFTWGLLIARLRRSDCSVASAVVHK
ncbi:MAG: hypothetical protein RIR21_557 [Pseudomonadota bacterium]